MSAGSALSLLQSLQKQFAESGVDPANMKAGEIPLEQLAQGFDPDQAKKLAGTLSGLVVRRHLLQLYLWLLLGLLLVFLLAVQRPRMLLLPLEM